MHRNIRYTKTVQPPKTRERRVWKPDSSNNKTIGTTSRGKLFSRSNNDNNNNNKSDTRRFITKKYTAPSHEHRHEGDDHYEDDCEYEEDYIYDEDAGFDNEYFDEDVDVYNNNDDDDVIYIKESYDNERAGRYGDKDGLFGDKEGRYGEKDGRYSEKDSRYGDRDGRYDDRDGRYDDRDSHYSDKDTRYGDRDNRYGDKDGRYGDRDGRYGDIDGCYNDRDGRYGDRDGRNGDRDNRYSGRDNRYGDRDGHYGDRDDRYGDRDDRYGDKNSRYDVKGGRDGDGYHNGNKNSNYDRHNSSIEKYEREFFSSTVRKRNRSSLDIADTADILKRDVRSRLGPRSPVEHEEENLDVDVGYDDSYMDEPQVVYNHPTSPRNRLDSSENYVYDGNIDESHPVDHEVEHVEDRVGTYTAPANQDKRVTKALLDEFGVSITDIADYLRRQIAEKENNGNLTLNQLLEEKFVKNKSTTGVVTPHANTETASASSSGKEKKSSISPEIIFDRASKSGSLKRDESKRKSEPATRKAESSTVKYNSHTNKSHTSSPHSERAAKSHSTQDRRQNRPSEKDYGKRSRSPDGKYHTVRLKDGERKSSYSPDRKSHRTCLSSSERESSKLKRRWSHDEHRVNNNAKKTSTSSIEAFLINAGNQGVNEFKKQQASQFIASKLQTAAHFQTLKPAIVFPVAPLVIPQHHVMVAAPPAPINPAIMSPVFIPINAPSATSDFLPLDTKNDMPKKQNIGAIERNTKKKQTGTKTNKASTSSSINETLSLLRKSSGSAHPQETCDINESVRDDENEEDTNEDADNDSETNNDENNSSSDDDEVSITRVVEPRKNSKKTVIQPIVAPIKPKESLPTASITNGSNRKVFLEDKNNKTTTPSESNSTNVTANNGKEISPRTRVRVPSWFNARLVELFKKRHKKVQQLKRAKQDPSGVANNPNRVKELQESLREIDREYIPLCHKTKEEFIKNGGTSSNSSRTKHEIAVLGFDESKPDIDVPALI